MSDKNQPTSAAEPKAAPEPPKELTPAEYAEKYEAEQAASSANIHGMHGVSDAFTRMQELMPFGGTAGGAFGRSNFDKQPLNALLDLLDQAKPSELEHAGNALIKAKDKLNEAAEELDQYVTKVEWQGEGAEEFRRFGRALAQHAWSIGTFANGAGEQMKTASTGLASVQAARPPRDGRLDPRPLKDFAEIEKIDSNPEYQMAVKVEGDRQEAINQMNRLASFYAVSEEMLAGQKEPRFPEGLRAAVPMPENRFEDPSGTSGATAPSRATSTPALDRDASVALGGATPGAAAVAPAPQPNVSMEIDSVAAPPAPPTATAPTSPPPTSPNGPSNGMPPFATGPVNPVQTGKGLPTKSIGASRAPGPLGRSGGTGPNNPTTGRSPGITGRPTSVGPGQTTPGRANPVGRPGIVGGTPAKSVNAGQTGPVGRSGASSVRAGNPNGIMGGSPQRASTNSPASRLPRGTVIGAEGPQAGRGTARPGQPGVIGSNSGSAPRSTGRGTPSSNGIVGAPRGSNPGRRPVGGSFTAGGAGLTGGRAEQRRPNEEEEQPGADRPDYLTEDEETWTARRRGAVPPVID
ncbi:hypothetical protein H9Y04_04170 [Streptomyces sp. TRM66268-LWL]|uniref:Uncharacterized protein n=1 Tax=Streptomyces polyasparticus TaxID=2767826 RepID=A0ABR7S9U1_9ACTN|nr:hypothetical protein [Streptomyces polyasparticus]MBC9711764.1 hypothetical protein [Streptomyces polyasparticus]